MTEHSVTMTPDDKYAHLAQPSCSCGWTVAGFVTAGVADYFTDRHLESVSS